MELKQFVTQTLNDIIDGIVDAQSHALEKKAAINPKHSLRSSGTSYYQAVSNEGFFSIQKIEFDIAITVTDEDKTKSGIGVISAVLNVGVQGEDNKTSNEISRVKFSVPILLPLEKVNF